MTNHDDVLRTEHFLQMYRYYGNLSWQIFATFIAAALVVFSLPFAAAQLLHSSLILMFNTVTAFGLAGVGFALFARYQHLAHRWIHNQYSPHSLEEHVSLVEWRQPFHQKGHGEPVTVWPAGLRFMWKITKHIHPRWHFVLIVVIPAFLVIVDAVLLVRTLLGLR